MSKSIRYVAFYGNGKPEGIGRITEDDSGLWGESKVAGRWVRDDDVLRALFFPDPDCELISDEEASAIATSLGRELD